MRVRRKSVAVLATVLVMMVSVFCGTNAFAAGDIEVSANSMALVPGDSATFTVRAKEFSGTISVSPQDPGVCSVTVDKNWLDNDSATVTVKGKAEGQTVIYIQAGDKQTVEEGKATGPRKTVSVTVSNNPNLPAGNEQEVEVTPVESAKLDNLTIVTGAKEVITLRPDIFEYNVKVPYGSTSMDVNAKVADGLKTEITGADNISDGSVVTVSVLDEEGNKTNYSIFVSYKEKQVEQLPAEEPLLTRNLLIIIGAALLVGGLLIGLIIGVLIGRKGKDDDFEEEEYTDSEEKDEKPLAVSKEYFGEEEAGIPLSRVPKDPVVAAPPVKPPVLPQQRPVMPANGMPLPPSAYRAQPVPQAPAQQARPVQQMPPQQARPVQQVPPQQARPVQQVPPQQARPAQQVPPQQARPVQQLPPQQARPVQQLPPQQARPAQQVPPQQARPVQQVPPQQARPAQQVPPQQARPAQQVPPQQARPVQQLPPQQARPVQQVPPQQAPAQQTPFAAAVPPQQVRPVQQQAPVMRPAPQPQPMPYRPAQQPVQQPPVQRPAPQPQTMPYRHAPQPAQQPVPQGQTFASLMQNSGQNHG